MRETVQKTIDTVTQLQTRFNGLSVPEGTDSLVQECLDEVGLGLNRCLGRLTESLSTQTEEEPKPDLHNLNNASQIVEGGLRFLEDESVEEKVPEALKPDLKEILQGYKIAMNALEARILAKRHNVDPQTLEDWDLPNELMIVVIDDNTSVLTHMGTFLKRKRPNLEGVHRIHIAGGKPKKYPENEGAKTLVLLDHKLGKIGADQLHGSDVVEEVLAAYPEALLIIHTSDAEKITAEPNNPYAQKGLPVVGKFAIKDIADLMRTRGFVTRT